MRRYLKNALAAIATAPSRVWTALVLIMNRVSGTVHEDRTDRAALVRDFNSDVASIEEAPIPISAYSALYVVLALFITAIGWSIVGSVDRIVVAQGRIVTTTPLIVMQPFTTSRILKIHVKAGDRVKKGQSLISFDPGFAQADEKSLGQKVQAFDAEAARINAELSGRTTFAVDSTSDPEMRTQADLFARRVSQFSSEMALRDSRRRQLEVQIDANNKAIEGLRHQVELAQKVADIRRQLQAKNAGSLLEVMVAEKEEVDFDLRLKSTIGENEKLEQQKEELIGERQSYIEQWRGDLNQRRVTVSQDLEQAVESLNKARKMKDFSEMTAPMDAVVLELADRSEGSVLREAETLITLVPDSAQLDLEADVLSRDVGFISVGDSVRVKLEAYPFQQYGTLDGRLDVLSPDSVPVKQGDKANVVFHAKVLLKETAGKVAGLGIRLRPGLVATAEINTGKHSIASYILDPVLGTLDESLREP